MRRYAELFGFDQRVVRLSGVFGPLERPTGSRCVMSPVCSLVHAAVAGTPVRVTARTLDSAADHISAEDVADGIARLADARAPAHDAYNLAHGTLTPFARAARGRRAQAGCASSSRWSSAPRTPTSISTRRAGVGASTPTTSPGRARDLGWQPRPLVEQLASYAGWLREGAAT